MATSLTEPSVLKAWSAAPEPRPPHPISASLSVSLPAAYALRSTVRPPNTEAADAATSEELLMNCRRETGDAEELVCSGIDPFECLVCGLIAESMVKRCEANLALPARGLQVRKSPRPPIEKKARKTRNTRNQPISCASSLSWLDF